MDREAKGKKGKKGDKGVQLQHMNKMASAHFNKADLPEGWERNVSTDGQTYFSHEESGTSTWDLTEGWDTHKDADGDDYYHHEESGSTTYTRPETMST